MSQLHLVRNSKHYTIQFFLFCIFCRFVSLVKNAMQNAECFNYIFKSPFPLLCGQICNFFWWKKIKIYNPGKKQWDQNLIFHMCIKLRRDKLFFKPYLHFYQLINQPVNQFIVIQSRTAIHENIFFKESNPDLTEITIKISFGQK